MREKYTNALEVLDKIILEMPDGDAQQWNMHGASVLLQAGRPDEAVARARDMAEKAEADLEQWGDLAILQMRIERMDDAAETLEGMEAWIEERYADEDSEARQRDEGYLAALRTTLAIDSGDWQEGINWLNKAIKLDEENKSRIPLTYIRLIRQGFYEEAIPLIQRDVQAPVRSDFWLGYVYYHLDDEGRAKREWTKATERDISKPENQHIMELILSRYYLGDPEGEGLSSVLQILNEKGSQYWAFFFLAGLGWAMRDNMANARTNFETAMLQRRSSGEGRLLPMEAWQYCRDLLEMEMQSVLIGYFDTDGAFAAFAEKHRETIDTAEEDLEAETETADESDAASEIAGPETEGGLSDE